jgi:hypothetical protein
VTRTNTSSGAESSAECLGTPEVAQMLGVSEDFIRAQVHQRGRGTRSVLILLAGGACGRRRNGVGDVVVQA